jgi:tetratricopeptide (TPR) repeat protein
MRCLRLWLFCLLLSVQGTVAAETDWKPLLEEADRAIAAREYELAELKLRQALNIQQHDGPAELTTGRTNYRLAEVYRVERKYSDAMQQYRAALVILALNPQQSTSLSGHIIDTNILVNNALYNLKSIPGCGDAARVLNGMGLLFEEQGQPQMAESLFKRALEMTATTNVSFASTIDQKMTPLDAAEIHTNLAEFYRKQSRFPDAEPLYRRALDLRQQAYGQQSADLIPHIRKLAGYYRSEHRTTEAEDLERKAGELGTVTP